MTTEITHCDTTTIVPSTTLGDNADRHNALVVKANDYDALERHQCDDLAITQGNAKRLAKLFRHAAWELRNRCDRAAIPAGTTWRHRDTGKMTKVIKVGGTTVMHDREGIDGECLLAVDLFIQWYDQLVESSKMYREFRIDFDAAETRTQSHSWTWRHIEFDGSYDSSDDRIGTASSQADAMAAVDQYIAMMGFVDFLDSVDDCDHCEDGVAVCPACSGHGCSRSNCRNGVVDCQHCGDGG